MVSNSTMNCSSKNSNEILPYLNNPDYYTLVNLNDLVVGEIYSYKYESHGSADSALRCVEIIENTPDTLKIRDVGWTIVVSYKKNGLLARGMRFYKENPYAPRKDYLTFTEGLALVPGGIKGPEGYLTNDMNMREISSYLGGKRRRRNKSKRTTNKRRNTRKRKTKTTKSRR